VNHLSSFFPDPKGARLHYQYWEDSSKGYDRIVIVLHGLGHHSGAYPALIPAFVSAGYKVVAPDFAGFGASPGERGSGGALAMADAVEALYRRIESAEGAREIEIVAHSMGAVAALLFLKRYPARRTRLAIVSPLLFGASGDALDAASMPNALMADLDRTVEELLADPSFLEGREAAFFVGEDDPLVPFERLTELVGKLPLKSPRIAGFPRERHDLIGGGHGDQVIAAILSWLSETRRN
jgi:alpha-beta hydrolase superfamily lysophospholipase